MSEAVLAGLAATIRDRRGAESGRSYTRTLLDGGPERCARKFGEEALELVIASLRSPVDAKAAIGEAADVLFHLLVLLEANGLKLADVLTELKRREGTSGHDEKARRSGPSGETK